MTTLAEDTDVTGGAPAPVLPPLRIGPIVSETPVVLAPMAGVTNAAFRRLCRESGAGLYVAEMVTSRALVERNVESLRIIAPDGDFRPRSIQVYGVDPATVGAAVRMVVEEDRADHVDLNFGCPVPKVTKRGGGAVLPWKRELFRAIVTAAVDAARGSDVPVTVKMRKGVDEEHLTYVEAGLTAQEVGVSAVALHGRTAADHYSGTADWDAIATLKEAVTDIPVLGNGDIWSAEDALAMVAHTGVDGVVVGRGCQGRPWLFADLEAAFAGRPDRVRPGMRDVATTMRRHAVLMCEVFPSEHKALSEMRKHMAWYLKGYVVGGDLRARLAQVSTLVELDDLLAELDLDQPYPGGPAEGPRGRAGSPKRPAVPDGWLDSRELSEEFRRRLAEAELSVSGG
ncbi:tRNA dihydrouridine synthase DusB [Cellulomonas endophytica]|uniref:tRNA dihydrouridine synthase DusB n=1 Tax=Cellulomonas endophytica TaxID=2494735 RepID=UPI0030B84EA7